MTLFLRWTAITISFVFLQSPFGLHCLKDRLENKRNYITRIREVHKDNNNVQDFIKLSFRSKNE